MQIAGLPERQKGASHFREYLGPILFLTSIFFTNFLARIILAPLMPIIEHDLGISHGAAGSLFFLITAGYFFTLLGSGFVSARLHHHRTIVLSAACMGLSLFFIAFGQGLTGMRVGLLLLGMAGGLYLPSGIASITALVDSRHWGKALAIHELAPNISFAAAPLITEIMLKWVSWRTVLVVIGALTLLLALTYARFGKGGDLPGKAPSISAFHTLFKLPSLWIMIILFTLGIGGTMGIYAMLPLFLATVHGMERSLANNVIGLSRMLCVFVAFLSGMANDWLGPRRTLTIILIFSGVTTMLLGVLSGPWLLVIVFVQPVMAVCFFPPAFVALSAIGASATRNVAVSLALPAAFMLGGGVMPLLIGVLGDRGRFDFGIIIVGAMILMGSLLVNFLRFHHEETACADERP